MQKNWILNNLDTLKYWLFIKNQLFSNKMIKKPNNKSDNKSEYYFRYILKGLFLGELYLKSQHVYDEIKDNLIILGIAFKYGLFKTI